MSRSSADVPGRITSRFPTSWGDVGVTFEDGRILSLELPLVEGSVDSPLALSGPSLYQVPAGCERTWRYLEITLKGGHAIPPPYIFPTGTGFQRRVWRRLLKVPYGRTVTYGELARAVGHPGAARAVGGACGANPLPLIIPCHRVVGSSGALGGFTSGLVWKEWLLSREHLLLPARP